MLNPNNLTNYIDLSRENKRNSTLFLQDEEKSKRKELIRNKLYPYLYSFRQIKDSTLSSLKGGKSKFNILKYIFIILIFILSFWLSNIYLFNYNILINYFSTYIINIKELFFNIFSSILKTPILNEYKIINNSSYPLFHWDKLNVEIIEKTGRNIYSCPNTIINLIIATLILLLALISLFFLISI